MARVLLECLTRRPSIGYPRHERFSDVSAPHALGALAAANRSDLVAFTTTRPRVRKLHRLDHCSGCGDTSASLIHLVRAPRDAVESEAKTLPAVYRYADERDRRYVDDIIDNARSYIEWRSRKLLIYYEAVLADPAAALRVMAAFLQLSGGDDDERNADDVGALGDDDDNDDAARCIALLPSLLAASERASAVIGARAPESAHALVPHYYASRGGVLGSHDTPLALPADVVDAVYSAYGDAVCEAETL